MGRQVVGRSNNHKKQQKSFSNNLVILTGNLGADAAFFGANDSAAAIRMATKSTFGGKEYVEWHSVVAFKELAQEVVEKCTKGRFIRVYGRLYTSKIENDGAAQFKTGSGCDQNQVPGPEEVSATGRSPDSGYAPPLFAVQRHRPGRLLVRREPPGSRTRRLSGGPFVTL